MGFGGIPASDPSLTPLPSQALRIARGYASPTRLAPAPGGRVLVADTAARLFYARLFELDPAIERLFRRTDMDAQRKNLMQTLTVVVKSLDRLDQILPAVQALGRRHAGYGVREAHYATVGEALLWTLETGLGEACTPDVRAAWAAAYGTLASVMIEAARDDAEATVDAAA
jgi:hemoglobin-like flavoprotein